MATLSTLFQGTSNLRSKINATNSFSITDVTASPVPNSGNTLGIEAKFNALTDKSRSFYKTLIVFYGLNYVLTKDVQHPLKVEVFPGMYIYSERPRIGRTSVGLRCLCADYYYTWWYYNQQRGAYVGAEPPAYHRKTDTYPERNPQHTPGLCKHLLRLSEFLIEKGFVLS